MVAFCKGIQSAAAVDSYVTPEPWAMPGYESEVIMAAGRLRAGQLHRAFRRRAHPPALRGLFPGRLTWFHAKLGISMSLQKLVDAGIIESYKIIVKGEKITMWFWLSLIALLCWSGSDLFSKIGCRDADTIQPPENGHGCGRGHGSARGL